MANSKYPGLRKASVKEVRELCKLPWVHDPALSTDACEARVLPDGRVLMYLAPGEKANLFPTRASAEEAHREYLESCRKAVEERAKPFVDPSVTLLPPVADFLRDVAAHAKSLGPRLHIPDDVLDGTPESLDAVDKALKKIPWAQRQVPDLVTPLVAYLGEVIRKATGGTWSTSTAPGHENEPMITTRGGNLVQPFASVFLPMVEPSRRIPLRSSPGVMVTPNRKPPSAAPSTPRGSR
jgi:hypothetical protein